MDSMKQSKNMSMVETTLNIGSGMVVAWCLTFWILPGMLALALSDMWEATLVTSVYSAASWVRSYFWRRFFA